MNYKKQYYLKNRESILEKSRLKYLENKDIIKSRRKEYIRNETNEERLKRLEFHKKYNYEHRKENRFKQQSDEYKFKQYMLSAKKRDYVFKLSLDTFKKIFHSKCFYCNKIDSRGIDRIDNNIGYTYENSVGCCEMCNKMKWKWNKEDFLNKIKEIYKIHF